MSGLWASLLQLVRGQRAQDYVRRLGLALVCSAVLLAIGLAMLFIYKAETGPLTGHADVALLSLFGGFILLLFAMILELWPITRIVGGQLQKLRSKLADEQEQVSRLKGFTMIAADLLWETDLHGMVTYVGGRMLDQLEFRGGSPLGQNYLDVIQLRAEHLAQMMDALENLRPYQGIVTQFHDKNGKRHLFELSARPLFDAQSRIIGYQGVGSDVTGKLVVQKQMAELAARDSLTGLSNRYDYTERLQTLFETTGGPAGLTLLAVDLDGFKMVNDTYGHDVGDGLLRQVAGRIREVLRTDDWCARLGGDEFVVVCERMPSLKQAEGLASRLLSAMSAPFQVDGARITIGASIGIAQAPSHGEDAATLMKHADLALYKAKADGKNRAIVFDTQLRASIDRRKKVEQRLGQAIKRDGLSIAYQPIFSLQDGKVCGFEALARWHDDELGVVSPGEFIAIAEQSGLIGALGEQILRAACFEAAGWQGLYGQMGMRVCVNVSPEQFQNPTFPAIVETCLTDSGLHPANLELEITENLILVDVDATVAMLAELKAIGISVAIDDFGAGYSSFGRLHQLPIDRLKIDRSIIEGLGQSKESKTITHAIIQLATNLNICVVAEGIENATQAKILHRAGCPAAQGYFLSKPMSPDMITELMETVLFKAA